MVLPTCLAPVRRTSRRVVRNVDPEVVRALKLRAAARGRSAEAEHREILRQALAGPLPVVDGLMAATALVHGLTLVSRNARDVAGTGAIVLDPFVKAKH